MNPTLQYPPTTTRAKSPAELARPSAAPERAHSPVTMFTANADESSRAARRVSAVERETLASAREIPAWATSLVAHLALLLFLGTLVHTTITERDPEITSTIIDDEIDPEAFRIDTSVVDELGNDSDLNIVSPAQALASATGVEPQEAMEHELQEDFTFEVPSSAPPQPVEEDFLQMVQANGTTEHVGGVPGAMDRLTYEIGNSLRQNKTLVIWLFDASGSLIERRQAIADRFENVYRQLRMLDDVQADQALTTAVVSFGSGTQVLTEDPVDDYQQVIAAVRSIEPDMSGKENTFAAVQLALNRWRSHRTSLRRNVMMILVTDERGDDFERVESVTAELARLGIRVYCVGDAAPFGREQGYVTWKYEDGFTEEIPVDAGPETVRMERLKLPFWGGGGFALERMSSGFGPYALTRLCRETGGLYLITAQSVHGPQFDPIAMRDYQPDYRPIRTYQNELGSNKAKAALVLTAEATRNKDFDVPNLPMDFNAPDDGTLRQQITPAQEVAARLDYPLQTLQAMLEQGLKDRGTLSEPRWKAGFDLALGRLLALRVRAHGYNVVLAAMKSNPQRFDKPDSNQWRLVPSQEVDANATVRKWHRLAEEALTRVVNEHPNTPWAAIAERELRTPMGWQWKEAKVVLPGQNTGGNPDQPMLLLAEEERRQMQRQQQQQRQRVRPKL